MFGKKPIILCFLVAAALVLCFVGSYTFSNAVADNYVKESGAPVGPSGGHLVLFFNGRLVSPHWRFVYVYNLQEGVFTGSTYDVFVSLFGRILETPESRNSANKDRPLGGAEKR